eukprot:NODE_12598_length_1214_cov_10.183993.p1 GENE.NODE_12598_length_1214_cov_10.183993~~NODE_12598_length_1214_cov_10.183993.p1  ORF type:complete len:296 (+),score=81.46 NODE_12598_length_1214_cov_10.183993:73-888(+)
MAEGWPSDGADGNYVCSACGGLVPEARRRAHTEQWCPALAAGAGAGADSSASEDENISAKVKALISPQYMAEIPVTLSFSPVPFCLSQRHDESTGKYNRHADYATGGQLWWSEVVLAEYLALTRRPPDAGGCAMVAPGTGEVDGGDGAVRLSFRPLPFGEEPSEEVCAWLESRGGARLVVCSDCLWQAHRHRPLAVTLARLLVSPGAEALVAYQLRDRVELQFFSILGHYNLAHERLDVVSAVRRVLFPPQLCGNQDPCESFFVHRVWSLN